MRIDPRLGLGAVGFADRPGGGKPRIVGVDFRAPDPAAEQGLAGFRAHRRPITAAFARTCNATRIRQFQSGKHQSLKIPMATLTVDATGQIRAWSRQAEELLGYSRSEAVGQSVEIIIPPHLRDRHWAGFGRFVQTGISVLPDVITTTAVHKNGQLVKLPISVKAVYGDDRKIMAVEATFHPSREAT
jgi:PAS domain S-box-containing protein